MWVVCCWEKTLKAPLERMLMIQYPWLNSWFWLTCVWVERKEFLRGKEEAGETLGTSRENYVLFQEAQSLSWVVIYLTSLQAKVNVPKDTKEKDGNEIAFLIHIPYTSIFLSPQSTNPNQATPIAFGCQPAHAGKRNCKHSTSPHLPQTTWYLG